MASLETILACVAALLALSAFALVARPSALGHRPIYGLALVTTIVASVAAAARLVDGGVVALALPLGLPGIGARFRLDSLSAFFLTVVNVGAAAASLYGIGYGAHEVARRQVLACFPAFLAAMTLVVLADDAFTFLLSWEFMSLASWVSVMARHREPGNTRAGYVYLVMACAGTLSLVAALGLVAGAGGGFDFESMRAAAPREWAAGVVLALVLVGAGSKAGIVPLHAWLPLAHPAAPSHVSALMSGVMTKVAVYGFVRIVFDLLGDPEWWWGLAVLVLGGVTSVLGVLYALMQHDLKRLLAYHTVENIGIIFIGLGLALAFQANGIGWAAALALTAALLHVLNHSLFKSLLFFGSGAVLVATGERDMERLGGLIRRMPATAFAFLVGSAAISALPPLNGFVSEWLTFQAILVSPVLPQWGLKFMVPAVGAMLALSATLAAACFVKAFGIVFLGRPRSAQAGTAVETDRFSIAAMLALALACVLVGVLPGYVIDALAHPVGALVGARMPAQAQVPWLSIIPVTEGRSSYNGLLMFAFIAIAASLTTAAVHRWGSRAVRRAPPWDCGFPDPSPTTQYTADSFAQPIRRVFGTLVFRAREHLDMPSPGDLRPARLRVDVRDLVWEFMYEPIAAAVRFAADRLNPLQFLTIRRYLGLVFGMLVLLLLALALWQ